MAAGFSLQFRFPPLRRASRDSDRNVIACVHKQRIAAQAAQERLHAAVLLEDLRREDWGVGFDADANHKAGFGLQSIAERARMLDGRCRIRSRPGEGTRIVVELPVADA